MISGVLGLVVIGIILAFGALILAETQDQIVSLEDITDETNDSQLTYAYNSTVNALVGIDTYSGWLPMLALASVIGVILIALIGAFMWVFAKGGMGGI